MTTLLSTHLLSQEVQPSSVWTLDAQEPPPYPGSEIAAQVHRYLPHSFQVAHWSAEDVSKLRDAVLQLVQVCRAEMGTGDTEVFAESIFLFRPTCTHFYTCKLFVENPTLLNRNWS